MSPDFSPLNTNSMNVSARAKVDLLLGLCGISGNYPISSVFSDFWFSTSSQVVSDRIPDSKS